MTFFLFHLYRESNISIIRILMLITSRFQLHGNLHFKFRIGQRRYCILLNCYFFCVSSGINRW